MPCSSLILKRRPRQRSYVGGFDVFFDPRRSDERDGKSRRDCASLLEEKRDDRENRVEDERRDRERAIGGAIYPAEHARRGRRWVDCIGRMVMRPSDLEITSQSPLRFSNRCFASVGGESAVDHHTVPRHKRRLVGTQP